MGVRETQKLATRRRVLDAASDLFNEIGFEDATVRAIANRAGVSVGSVFTTFTSKSDILSQVMQDRLEALYEETGRVIPLMRGSVADRCRSLFAVLYAFEMRRVKLFLAHIAVAYRWEMEPAARPFGANQAFRGLLTAWLQDGAARGDVRADVDCEAVIDLLLGVYAWNYRLAAAEDAESERLTGIMDKQIGMIFEGLRPRP